MQTRDMSDEQRLEMMLDYASVLLPMFTAMRSSRRAPSTHSSENPSQILSKSFSPIATENKRTGYDPLPS